MTKKELSQLRYLSKEIDILKMQIKDLEDKAEKQTASDVVSGSNPVFPYERRRFHIEGIDLKIYEKRLRRLRHKLNKRMEQLIKQRELLETYIASIDDSMIRLILTLRYVEGLSWRQVAHRIGGGNTPDSVRKMHDRFLKGGEQVAKEDQKKNV